MAAGYAVAVRNSRLDAITTYTGNAGKLVIYAGTRPATGGAAGTVLATFTLGTPFAGAAASGSLTVTLPADVNASATGTAAWARLFKTDGTTIVMDLGVGTSGQEVTLNSTSLTSGVACSVTSFVITAGNP